MAVIGTDTQRISNVLKYELFEEFGHCREAATAFETVAKTYRVGEVLGKITANGKRRISVPASVDGSQTLDAICLEDKVVPANTDTKVLVLVSGPAGVSKGALQFEGTYSGPNKDAAYVILEGRGIRVLETV